jgi:hypothetical protein
MTVSRRFSPFRMVLTCTVIFLSPARGQFVDNFDQPSLTYDAAGVNGWTFYSGDGSATMSFATFRNGIASIHVDATKDKLGIWWALIRRRISQGMDLRLLADPRFALRVEARIHVSSAPKRVNLHLNTQRTTDFHSHLMEYDIPDTTAWHTISMTTHGFDAQPGDSVYGQLALMDWGLSRYRVDLDYYRVDIVRTDSAGPDVGLPQAYHPSIPNLGTFTHHIPVVEEGTIDSEFRDMNFRDWSARDEGGETKLLAVNGTQMSIFRWDLSAYAGKKVVGAGVLELTTYELQRSPDYQKDFGMVHCSEILSGDPRWQGKDVTYNSLCQGRPMADVVNTQMIIDIDVSPKRGTKTLATIPAPVLQRLIDGKTLGIAVRPLGAVQASFYSKDNQGGVYAASLHFSLESTDGNASGRR